MERPPRARGAAARHAVPRSTATILGEGQIGIAPPRECRGDSAIPAVCESASRRPSCSSAQKPSRLGPTAAVLSSLVASQRRRRASPQPAPRVNQRQPSSSTQSRVAATRCHGTRHRSGTPSFVRHGTRPAPRSRVAGPRRADAHVPPPWGWTCHTARSGCAASGSPLLGTRSPSLASGAARSHRTGCRRPGGRGRAMDGASGEIGSPR